MSLDREVLRLLARESGRLLGELGVRPGDHEWIRRHAETIGSLATPGKRRGPLARLYDRLARKAARIAR
jgi:hypothetical protein